MTNNANQPGVKTGNKKPFHYKSKSKNKAKGNPGNNNNNNGNANVNVYAGNPSKKSYDKMVKMMGPFPDDIDDYEDSAPITPPLQFTGPLQPGMTASLPPIEKEPLPLTPAQIAIIENYNKNKDLIDPLYTLIKTKSGRDTAKIHSLLQQFYERNNDCKITTTGNTNLMGFCVLYDDCETVDYISEAFPSFKVDMPQIMGIQNCYAVFGKSLQTNKSFVNFLNRKQISNDFLLTDLLNCASESLFRQENINFYLNWIKAHNTDSAWTQMFVDNCCKNNNRPLISEMCRHDYFNKALIKALHNPELINRAQLKEWLENALKRGAIDKAGPQKDKVDTLEMANINLSSNAHFATSQDNFKMLGNKAAASTPEVVVKKKRISSMVGL